MVDAVETMAWTGEVPWHGLGNKVAANLSPSQMVKAAGLDWAVEKRALFISDGMNKASRVPDRFALVRSSDNRVLDLVGKAYIPVQNEQAMSFFKQFVEAGDAKMETAGSLCGGQYIWGLAKFEQSFAIGRGSKEDRLLSYALVMNPHRHGKGMVLQQTSVRVVCWNTLSMALREKGANGRRVSMPHIREFTKEVQAQAAETMGLVRGQFNEFKEQAQFLASKPCTPDEATPYFQQVLGIDPEKPETKSGARTMAKLEQALTSGPGAELPSSEGTWWGALNAVTFVVDHRLGNDRDKVMRDNWLGYRGQTKRKALKLALELAKAA